MIAAPSFFGGSISTVELKLNDRFCQREGKVTLTERRVCGNLSRFNGKKKENIGTESLEPINQI